MRGSPGRSRGVLQRVKKVTPTDNIIRGNRIYRLDLICGHIVYRSNWWKVRGSKGIKTAECQECRLAEEREEMKDAGLD